MIVKWFGSECRRARNQARLATAGLLAEEERRLLGAHTGRCSKCRYYTAELKALSGSLREWERSVAESVISRECAAQWHRAIREQPRNEAKTNAKAGSAVTDNREAVWAGLDRALPVSLVFVWLLTIGIHLNTPQISPTSGYGFTPNVEEIRIVMEWLLQMRREPV